MLILWEMIRFSGTKYPKLQRYSETLRSDLLPFVGIALKFQNRVISLKLFSEDCCLTAAFGFQTVVVSLRNAASIETAESAGCISHGIIKSASVRAGECRVASTYSQRP